MKTNFAKYSLILIAGLFANNANGQSATETRRSFSKAEVEVLRVNEDFDRAIVARDVAAYERIFANEFIFTGFDGAVTDREKEIEKVRSRNLKFEYGKSDDVRVKVFGRTAVVTGRFTARGKNDGEVFSFVERYTAVYVKRDGQWQMVAEHASEVKGN
jgi:ketosteroid isomerase-like protein